MGRAAGRRARGRTKLQRAQKETSRQALLEAAKYLFTNGSYAGTTIDDIVGRAGVSRATFYRHFTDRAAIAKEIFEQLDPVFLDLYDQLAAYGDPSEVQIADWLDRMLDVLKAHRSFLRAMREAESIELEGDASLPPMHDVLIRRLAPTMPAFRRALLPGEQGEEARIAAHLLLFQFAELCNAVVVRRSIDQAIGVRVLARLFRRFIEDA
jgi:AcrR family transcriptional regulator